MRRPGKTISHLVGRNDKKAFEARVILSAPKMAKGRATEQGGWLPNQYQQYQENRIFLEWLKLAA